MNLFAKALSTEQLSVVLKSVSCIMDLSVLKDKYHNDCFTSLKKLIKVSDTEKKVHGQISKGHIK